MDKYEVFCDHCKKTVIATIDARWETRSNIGNIGEVATAIVKYATCPKCGKELNIPEIEEQNTEKFYLKAGFTKTESGWHK